jgi:hypothetical protein
MMTQEEMERVRNKAWMKGLLDRLARNGTISTTMHQLMQRFERKTSRRTERFINRLNYFLTQENISLMDNVDLKTVRVDKLISFSINPRITRQLFYGSESVFEARHIDEIAEKLNLTIYSTPERPMAGCQFSPDGSNDKLDCLCEDPEGFKVVLELKTQSGQGGLEQVVRYMALIERHFETEEVRGVLVSGIAPPTTVEAYKLLKRHGLDLRWYVYTYDDKNSLIVDLKYIDDLYQI